MRSTFLLIGAALLTGCASTPRHDPTSPVVMDPLVEAQQALASGNLRQAETLLGSAPAELGAGDTRSQVRVLLLSELALQHGDDAEAVRIAEMVRTVNPDDPRAAELLGKVALGQGRFNDAAPLFESARIFYTLDDDSQRASDLLQLANGLAAYGEGRVSEARRNWSRIQDPALRAQFEQAYASVVDAASE